MKLIPLSQGKFAMVSNRDYTWLNKHKWRSYPHHNTFYVVRTSVNGRIRKNILMHREILKPRKGFHSDHKDRNGLNNQRSNLREATHGQNQANRRARGVSKYLGVAYNRALKKWVAMISNKGTNTYLGLYTSERRAAKAYDSQAKKIHGKFANLNFKLK